MSEFTGETNTLFFVYTIFNAEQVLILSGLLVVCSAYVLPVAHTGEQSADFMGRTAPVLLSTRGMSPRSALDIVRYSGRIVKMIVVDTASHIQYFLAP